MVISKKAAVATTVLAAVSVQMMAMAGPLDKILKGALVGVGVSALAPKLDDGINKLTGTEKTNAEWTKVVPIISVGRGASVGGCQVLGVRRQVERVKAVAQLETRIAGINVKALIPVDNLNPTDRPQRVEGVGVSGIVDVKL